MNRAVGLALAAALVSTCSPLFVTPTASADQNDGKLTVRVVRDVNGNGSHEAALELGVAGIKVRVTAPNDQSAEGTTAADGTVAVDTTSLPGGRYRVQATIPDALSYLKPAPAGAGLSSLTEFVDVSAGKAADVTMGVWNPADHCRDNPDLITTCRRNGDNPGTATHDFATNFDGAFFGVPGKQALGDVELSEDGSELYVVALNEKKPHVYDATAATAAAPKASYAIPDPGCPSVDDWRPGGLGVRDGVVYVGGVCSGESTQQTSDLKAAVHKFAGGAFGTSPALTKSLDFVRGASYYVRPQSAKWFPWTAAANDVYDTYPMPWPTNIGIDLNRACPEADGTYSWESTGTCPNNAPAGEAVEYYPGEKLSHVHTETSQGGLAVVHGEDRLPAIVTDPTAQRAGGIGWFDDVDGSMYTDDHDNADKVGDEPSEGRGKSNGLADLEALRGLAPVQIGNRVWFDADADGVQDGDEPALPGVKASLVPCAGGAPVASKTTNAKGEYYFGTADGVRTGACYQVLFDYSAADTGGVPGTPSASSLSWTSKGSSGDECADSDVDPATGRAEVTVGGAGSVDHCVDGGLSLPINRLGDYAWIDADRDGVQDEGSKPVYGMTVRLQGTSYSTTTDADGKYLFDKLPDGTYTVCFDIETLPADYSGYLPTRQNAGGNDDKDSDADPRTGCVAPVALGPNRREDLTPDAGFRPPNRLGDYAWIDANKNGLQDTDEKPVADVVVKLQGTAYPSTKTDASGKYSFEGLPDGEYAVCFDVATLPAAVKDYQVTKPEQGDDRAKDANADPGTGCAKSTKLDVDRPEDPTIDLGLISPVNRLGDYVWLDADRDGVQDAGEKGVPDVTVTLKGTDRTTKTDKDGKYLFTDLPDGTYTVCFDVANLPAPVKDASLTSVNAGGDDTKDSDAGADGCTPATTVGTGKREDLTLDAGLVTALDRIGDHVWTDANRDGIQDAGEKDSDADPVTRCAPRSRSARPSGRT